MLKQDEYIKRFDDPKFTAFDFLSLFSAVYASEKEYSFDRDDLIEFISQCKSNSSFTEILSDINLKSNGVSYYSEEFDEAIAKLKWGGILYTISPERDSKIYIFEGIPVSQLMEGRENYIDDMEHFTCEYRGLNINNSETRKRSLVLDVTTKKD